MQNSLDSNYLQANTCKLFEAAAWQYARTDSKQGLTKQDAAGLVLFIEQLKQQCPNKMGLDSLKVLDAGCGYGKNLSRFQQEGFTAQGIEQSPTLSSIGQDLGLSIRTQNLLFLSDHATWDGIWASHLLDFFSATICIRLMQSFFKALKPSGQLYVTILTAAQTSPLTGDGTGSDPNEGATGESSATIPFHRWLGAPLFLDPIANPTLTQDLTLTIWQENDFLSLLRQSGFQVLKRSENFTHFNSHLTTVAFLAQKQSDHSLDQIPENRS